jgi:hypothetical protein
LERVKLEEKNLKLYWKCKATFILKQIFLAKVTLILKRMEYLFIISQFFIDKMCPISRKACLDTFGKYAAHCKALPDFKYAHNFFKNVLFDIFRWTRA